MRACEPGREELTLVLADDFVRCSTFVSPVAPDTAKGTSPRAPYVAASDVSVVLMRSLTYLPRDVGLHCVFDFFIVPTHPVELATLLWGSLHLLAPFRVHALLQASNMAIRRVPIDCKENLCLPLRKRLGCVIWRRCNVSGSPIEFLQN